MNTAQHPSSRYNPYAKRPGYASNTGAIIPPQQRTHLPTPPLEDMRNRSTPAYQAVPQQQQMNDPRAMAYRLPQLPVGAQDGRRQSSTVPMSYSSQMFGDPQLDMSQRHTSLDPSQFVMVPAGYMPIYPGQQFEQWPAGVNAPAANSAWPGSGQLANPYALPPTYNAAQFQRPLPAAPPGPVEKPKRRRAPPAPQYLHMTVHEMVEELAYRKVDTQAMQARKAKKAEYIDQLQKADREGRLGRGAWKECHGDVLPISERGGGM